MRYGICVPQSRRIRGSAPGRRLARLAEDAGWDGLFVWDHVVFPYGGGHEVADPWVLLTAVAPGDRADQVRSAGHPVARRRPGVLARQTTTLDRLSGGRLVFGAGLGFTLAAEFGTWGEPVRPRVVAQRLDEGLAVLAGLWSGERVDFRGEQVTAADVSSGRPRCGGRARRSGSAATGRTGCRCAGRPDGTAWYRRSSAPTDPGSRPRRWWPRSSPQSANSGPANSGPPNSGPPNSGPPNSAGEAPFDVVITGRTPPGRLAEAQEVTGAIAAAGATWWLEGFRPQPGEQAAALRRIERPAPLTG